MNTYLWKNKIDTNIWAKHLKDFDFYTSMS